MRVDVWSDVVCPWCYIGKRRLEAALAAFEHADAVEVVFHSFELDPNAPAVASESLSEMLSRKYRMPLAKAEEMQAHVTGVARQDGLEFRFAEARPENTFTAHRLLHYAASQSRQGAMKEALMNAYFCEGGRVGDPETLVRVGVSAGLDADAVRATVADPSAFADAVRQDEAAARSLGIRGVPFFVIDQKYGISGAQPAEALRRALAQAWSERPVAAPDAEGCDADGCELPPG